MSRVDEPLTRAAIWEAAAMTIAQHEGRGTSYAPGTCACCTPDGCAQLAWAVAIRAGRSAVYPEPQHQPVDRLAVAL
ncbi:hypothetical protein BDK92_7221 [Micromonospora pisi]|uniref:Uncharacterized protein n=1 Tax=Micromonospora pisi TaxID=589240 RepID=A0A495JUS3_9ACTN|nr:hypothetical protein [Micromonospora pisi]RKR92743.1 hypothetical protein BDK92_7221 [Micromonospora pisi]